MKDRGKLDMAMNTIQRFKYCEEERATQRSGAEHNRRNITNLAAFHLKCQSKQNKLTSNLSGDRQRGHVLPVADIVDTLQKKSIVHRKQLCVTMWLRDKAVHAN